MSKMEIYDPAMCCSTGVCGPSVNPELIRVAAVIENLKKNGIEIKRHNLSSEPQAYMHNAVISKELHTKGAKILPITLVDGKIVKEAGHLTNEEFAAYLGVDIDKVQSSAQPRANQYNRGSKRYF